MRGLILGGLFLVPQLAAAHGGGLDAYGCHNNRKAGGYHCHRGQLAGEYFGSKSEMLQRLSATEKPAKLAAEKPKKNTPAGKKEWELIAEAGTAVKFVYVSPAGLKDREYVADLLGQVRNRNGRNRHIQVMLFDDKSVVPRSFPMSDKAMLHQRAQYNFNPTNGFEEFVWVKVTNSKSSPPGQKTIKDSIRPK